MPPAPSTPVTWYEPSVVRRTSIATEPAGRPGRRAPKKPSSFYGNERRIIAELAGERNRHTCCGPQPVEVDRVDLGTALTQPPAKRVCRGGEHAGAARAVRELF